MRGPVQAAAMAATQPTSRDSGFTEAATRRILIRKDFQTVSNLADGLGYVELLRGRGAWKWALMGYPRLSRFSL